ncbi:hypothetical protein XalbCFBP2523_14565 [Xanthomonas albilineans]|nr:hypothetical protein XalbCFBP2523_14565 [Xanthomonas albilineans]
MACRGGTHHVPFAGEPARAEHRANVAIGLRTQHTAEHRNDSGTRISCPALDNAMPASKCD